ncbi:MAG: ribbon-helix-helix protein, CopG family [Verrucomicrobiota bacterium]
MSKNDAIKVRVNSEMKKKLKCAAEINDVEMSDIVRAALRAYLERSSHALTI